MRKQQQAGIVSIIVATLLIIIVSLIVVAFAQVSRREQRESLDAQLSTQAYYAAETGVNAATAIIKNNPSALGTTQNECKPATGPFSTISYDLSDPGSPNSTVITCLQVNPTPSTLTYQLSKDSATVFPVVPKNGATIGSLTFSWPKSAGFSGTNVDCKSVDTGSAWKLPTENTWNSDWGCPFAAIRADLVAGDTLSRDALLNNDNVSLMLPTTNGAGTGNLNDVSSAQCTSICRVTFDVSGLNSRIIYVRLVSVYQGGENVTVSGTDSAGTAISFTKAQAKIDSTGRAQDVLRRIVVSVPLQQSSGTAPVQALTSGDSVCKRFGVFTGFYTNYAPPDSGCDEL